MLSLATSSNTTHVFFAHSPITYSIALATIAHLGLDTHLLIGARGLSGPRIHFSVMDDGEWSPERTGHVLAQIADHVPADNVIALYLPHTAFLLGKLAKLCDRITQIAYLEEGYTSAFKPLLNHGVAPTQVNLAELEIALIANRTFDRLGLDKQKLSTLNQLADNAFDSSCLKYAGAYACSHDAFAGLPKVTQLTLAASPQIEPARLLSFFGVRNVYGDDTDNQAKRLHACTAITAITRSLQTIDKQSPVLVKLHPKDYNGLHDAFYAQLKALGVDYTDYCTQRGLDPNIEPALHNFSHYHVFGVTAQVKYIVQFCGAHRLTRYAAFS